VRSRFDSASAADLSHLTREGRESAAEAVQQTSAGENVGE